MRFLRAATQPAVLKTDEVEELAPKLEGACKSFPVVLLYLHGSHAHGTQGALSDVDMAVLFDGPRARDNRLYLDMLAALEQACGREDVDLAVLNAAGPILKSRVVRSGRLIYSRSDRERVLFEAFAIKEALDFEHYSRVYDDALFRQIKEGRILGGP
jgi:predicted nucleotidyltransferase